MDFLTLALCKKASGGIIPTKVSDLTNDAGYVTATALNGYAQEAVVNAALAGKQDALTFDDAPTAGSDHPVKSGGVASAIASAITDAFAGISQFSLYKCGQGEYDPSTKVPTIANPDSLHIYLVPDTGSNYYEYVYVNSAWDLIGSTEVDLTGYVQESDLEDYVKTEDLPAVPTKVSELENDEGYITKPRTTGFLRNISADDVETMGPGFIGGVNTAYMVIVDVSAQEYAWVLNETGHVKIGPGNEEAGKTVFGDTVVYYYNVKPTETESQSGYDAVDNTKPCMGISFFEEEHTASGYAAAIVGSINPGGKKVSTYTEKDYLTEHQSLAGYAKTADVNTALAGKQDTLQFDDTPTQASTKMLTSGKIYNALAAKQNTLSFDNAPTQNSGNPVKSGGVYTALAGKSNTGHTHAYSELTGKPTIPTVPTISTSISSDASSDQKTASPKAVKTYVDGKVPTNLVTGDGASYTVKVSTSAPASGTASSIITIVVPE